jgi:hypothetical protein
MEVAMSTSMTSYLTITKAIIEECQVGKQVFCDHPMTILHKMYVDIHAFCVNYDNMDAIHSDVIFEKIDDNLPNVEKK